MTPSEFNTCVDKYADGLYRFIRKNIKDEDDARDIVQDSFEKTWNKVSEVSFEKAKSYLFTAAYHTMIDHIRKNSKMVMMEEYHEPAVIHHSRSDLKEVLNQALDRLPTIQKSVLMLRDYEGYNYDEIASITGLSDSQVKVYIYRARMSVKSFIGSLENVLS